MPLLQRLRSMSRWSLTEGAVSRGYPKGQPFTALVCLEHALWPGCFVQHRAISVDLSDVVAIFNSLKLNKLMAHPLTDTSGQPLDQVSRSMPSCRDHLYIT